MTKEQLIVLEWLKETFTAREGNCWFVFDVIADIRFQYWGLPDSEFETTEIPHLRAFGELTNLHQFQVIQAFAEWGIQKMEGRVDDR